MFKFPEAFKIIHHQIAGHSQHAEDEHHVHIYHDSTPDHQNADIYPEHQTHNDEQQEVHVYHDQDDAHQLSASPYPLDHDIQSHSSSHSLHKPQDPPQHPESPPDGHSPNDFSAQYHHHTAPHQDQIGHNYIIHEQHSTPDHESTPEHHIVYEQRDARHNFPKEHYPNRQSQNPISHDSYSQHPIHRHTKHIQQHTSPHGKQHQYEMFDTASRKRKRHAVDDHWQSNTVSVGDKRIAGVSILKQKLLTY